MTGVLKLLLFCLAIAALAVPAAASAAALIYTDAGGGSYVSEPAKLRYAYNHTGVDAPVRLKRLKWERWGSAKANASGHLRVCIPPGPCFSGPAKVKARGLDGGYYTRLLIRIEGGQGLTFPLPAGD